MFDRAVLDVRSGRAVAVKAALLPVSIAVHSILFGVVLWLAVWSVRFPVDAPAFAAAFRIGMAVPVPPAPAQPKASQPQPVQRTTPADVAQLAPNVVPDQVPVSVSSGPSTTGSEADGSVGVDGGSEFGVDGGVDVGAGPGPIVGTPETGPVRVDGTNVKAPVVINRVPPAYPMPARMLRKSGFVEVECVIDRFGSVRDVRVVRSDFEPFSEEAVRAVKQWRFRPGTLRGQAVDVIFRLTVEFKMQ